MYETIIASYQQCSLTNHAHIDHLGLFWLLQIWEHLDMACLLKAELKLWYTSNALWPDLLPCDPDLIPSPWAWIPFISVTWPHSLWPWFHSFYMNLNSFHPCDLTSFLVTLISFHPYDPNFLSSLWPWPHLLWPWLPSLWPRIPFFHVYLSNYLHYNPDLLLMTMISFCFCDPHLPCDPSFPVTLTFFPLTSTSFLSLEVILKHVLPAKSYLFSIFWT